LNNGSAWNAIGSPVAAANGTVAWDIDNNTQVSNAALVKIEDVSNPTVVYDQSNVTFDVVGTFDILHPENGDIVIAEDPYNITWNKAGIGVNNVILEYSTDQGSNWTHVVSTGNNTVPNTGTYFWSSVPGDALSSYCKIRMRDINNAYANDTGAGYFDLRGELTVTKPTGGESWDLATIENITWSKKGNIPTVDISYSYNNGTNWTTLIAGVTASNLTWAWNITNVTQLTTQGKIKVADSSNANVVNSVSEGTFGIKGRVIVTQPDAAGIVLLFGGEPYNITWAKYGTIANVNLSYSTDGGLTWPAGNSIDAMVNATSGTPYAWGVPDVIGTNLSVKIVDVDNPAVSDVSNNSFAIKGSMLVVSPNGNENWLKGSSQQIQWKPTGTYPGNVLLQYSSNGVNWTDIALASAGTNNITQTYNWSVPDAISDTLLVKVTTQTGKPSIEVNDTSNATFKVKGSVVVTAPNGGEIWYVNDTNRQIRWSSVGTVSPVKIEYSTDNGGNWVVITDNYTGAEGANVYNWTPVPDLKSEECLIKISDNRTAFITEVTDVSNTSFSVRPIINVTQPASGQNVIVNSVTTPIRWTYTGTQLSTVNVDYSLDGGTNWTAIASGVAASAGNTYIWPTVPATTSLNGKVRIVDSTNSQVYGYSPTFNIVGALRIVAPNGGEHYKVGSNQSVTWVATSVTSVQAYYSLNNGSAWNAIGSPVAAANGTVAWDIDNNTQVSNAALVKIEDVSNPTVVNDVANATFDVVGVFDITHPESGDVVIAEDAYNITWAKKGIGLNNVILQYSTDYGNNWTNIITTGNNTVPNTGTYFWPSVPADVLSHYCKIRITDPSNAYANDTGAGYFDLRGSVSVTRPTGGESWDMATIENITWSKKGNIPTVDISYSYNNGTNWTTLATGITGSNLIWPWNITAGYQTTTQGKIKVADSLNPDVVYDISQGTFGIKGKLTITAPNDPGVVLTYNAAPYSITWAKFGTIANVNLSYSTDGGLTYPNAIANNVNVTSGTPYSWGIPDAIGVNLSVKIVDVDNPAVTDVSNNTFAVKGDVLVVSPNGNENWLKGSSQQIQWKPTGTYPGNVLLQYSSNGVNWTDIALAAAGNHNVTQVYNWTVPDSIGDTLRVKVSTQTNQSAIEVNDTSNATFKIKGNVQVTSPNGGEIWYVNDTNRQIKWSSVGTVSPVKIEYSTDNGGNWIVISNNTVGIEGANTYNWTPVPDLKSEECLVRVSDNRTIFSSEVTDNSNASFSVRPVINITQPASGDDVIVNSVTTPIRWTYTGTQLSTVDIQYSTNGGTNWTTIASGVAASAGNTYIWPTVPATTTLNGKVKVYDSTNQNIEGISPTFNIVGALRVVSPNGNENYKAGSNQSVSWVATSVTTVQAYYSLNNGSSWTAIGSPVPAANGTVAWDIDANSQVSNAALVKIEDVSNPTVVFDNSNATFGIIAAFDITHPESGDVVIAEDPYNITWTKKGVGVNNVYLEYSTDSGNNWTAVVAGNATVPNTGTYYWASVPGNVLASLCKVRVTDLNNVNATDSGASFFDLRGALTVTRPTGGESWDLATTQNINWTKKGNIAAVDISYSGNNGTNWTTLISGVTASNLSWGWNITNATQLTTQGKIKVADSSNANIVYDISQSTFGIKGRLAIDQPALPGIVLQYGSTPYSITWTRYGAIANVNLSYSTDGGLTYPNTIANTINATLGTPYAWGVPDAIGVNLSVKIVDVDNPAVTNVSSNKFAIKGDMLVVSPNGNENWLKGTTQQIQWKPTGTYPSNVLLQYSSDGNTWTDIGLASAGNDNITQVYNWTVPDSIGDTLVVKVSTQTNKTAIDVNDTSNATFKIKGNVQVTSPNGGEIWYVNDTNRQIRWSSVGTVSPVKIEYSTDNGGNWILISNNYAGVEGANVYNWTPVPDLKSEECLVRVADNRTAFNNEVTDTANATFSVRPVINVTQPESAANIQVDSTTTPIRWTYTGTQLNTVNVEYSSNGGVNWTTIASGVAASAGNTYVWPQVPVVKTSNAKVRVYDSTNPSIVGVSSTFNIVGKLQLSIPTDGSQSWEILGNTSSFIVWNATAVNTMNIYYSTNGTGGPWTYSQSVNATVGSYAWDVPAIVTNNARIKIADATNENVTYDVSANDFKLIEKFNVTAPTNGVILVANQTFDINWTRKSATALANVNLYFYNGTAYSLIAANVSNSGTYMGWRVPDTVISSFCKVKVENPINANNYAESDNPFGIRGNITVTSPNIGTEQWDAGATYPITWNFVGPIQNVTVQYSANSTDGPWETLVGRTSAGSNGVGSWNWTIANDTTLSTKARIKVFDADNFGGLTTDVSNNNFTTRGAVRMDAPSASGIVVGVGDNYNITWTVFGAIQNINLSYSTNGASGPWNAIANGISATPPVFEWPIPDAISNGVRVKINDRDNPNVFNISSNNFTVVGKVYVNKPRTGEPDWVVGDVRQIRWTPTGTFSFVKLEGSTNGFADENQTWTIGTVDAGSSGVIQTYNYTVDDKVSANVKIRVSDADTNRNPYVRDVSTESFKIKGKLIVVQPNSGNEEWTAGTQPTSIPVQWQTIGTVPAVKIELFDGANWLVMTNLTPSNGTFSNYTIPDSAVNITKQAKVRITDVNDSSVNDTSDTAFLIKGALSISHPNSVGEGITVNSTYPINWTKTGIYAGSDTIKIEYNTNDGSWKSVYSEGLNITGAAVDASLGSFPWTVPDDLSSNVKVKLTRNAYPATTSTSSQVRIIGSITVTNPVQGVKWQVNDTYAVKWTKQGSIAQVAISYSGDGQNYTFLDFAPGSSGEAGYQWNVNNTPGILSQNATIKIADASDSSVYNLSPPFAVVPKFALTGPSVSQQLTANREAYITWNKWGYASTVNIYYSKTDFAEGNGTNVAMNVTNNGNYTWAVPDDLSNSVKVRVVYPADPAVYNTTSEFRIVPAYNVLAPFSSNTPYNHKWPVGTVEQIKWNCTSAQAPAVKIYYSIDGGGNYSYLISSNASNAGLADANRTYNWTVDDTVSQAFKVKIQDADSGRSDISAESPYNSKIMGYLNITYPNGNETFNVTQPCTITWDHLGSSVTTVKLDISTDNFTTASVIAASTANDGIYNEVNWTMPDMISTTAKVRVMATNDPDAFDTSTNYFKIRGWFNISQPADGDRLPIGYNASLRWNTTGNISKVNVYAYSTIGANDTRFSYTLASPYVIAQNYTGNVPNGQTNYTWLAVDNATNHTRIRVVDANDDGVYAESAGNFSMIGSFHVTSPNGNESWIVGSMHNITWVPTGSSIHQAKITYSTNGVSGPWSPIAENYGTADDGIVANNGTYLWTIPDKLSPDVMVRIEDPLDSSVNDTSDSVFKIRADFAINVPVGGERWVTNENHTISFYTTGNVSSVNIFFSKDNFATSTPVVSNLSCSIGSNSYTWKIPDPVALYSMNSSDLPINAKLRIYDGNDSTIYTDSPSFHIDYYNVTWDVRDFLTNLPISGGLSVNDSSGWSQSSLASPIFHKTPYGGWEAAWAQKDYGETTAKYVSDSDQTVTVLLESKVVHVWESVTSYVYDPANDKITFSITLSRDGSVVSGASNCTVSIFDFDGNLSAMTSRGGITQTLVTAGSNETLAQAQDTYVSNHLNQDIYFTDTKTLVLQDPTADDAGYFSVILYGTGINTTKAYNARSKTENVLSGKFKTPFIINVADTASLYNMSETITSRIDVPLSVIQLGLTQQLANQTAIIQDKMDEQKAVIENKTTEMKAAIDSSIASFETRSNEALVKLEAGANQTLNASQQATASAQYLEATAKKYSWSASVSPDPALTGDTVTITLQGQPGLVPLLNVYSWDNKAIIQDRSLVESTSGLYTYSFTADSRFTPGKAYTYVISEQVTGGLVSGSGTVESMSLTTIAGLASAAPEAERSAKKALQAIKAVESVVTSGDNINIAITLRDLKKSVDELPGVLAKESGGGSGKISEAVNEIADRLKVLGVDEGLNFNELLEKALGDSPTMKEVRSKTDSINSVVAILLQIFENRFGGVDSPVVSTSLAPGSVRFKVVAVNPSKIKKQVVQVKTYLPEEVKPKDIIDLGGLDVEYDQEKSIYYVYRNALELAPSEIKSFEVEVEDVWLVSQTKLDDLKSRVDTVVAKADRTEYAERVKEISDKVYPRLKDIAASQLDESVSRSQHIGIYRQNLETMKSIAEDISRMEKILATAGGPIAPDMLTKTKVKAESPTKTITWIVIFIIIVFIGLMAGVLFFTWNRQTKLSREELLAAKKSAFSDGGSDAHGSPDQEKKT